MLFLFTTICIKKSIAYKVYKAYVCDDENPEDFRVNLICQRLHLHHLQRSPLPSLEW